MGRLGRKLRRGGRGIGRGGRLFAVLGEGWASSFNEETEQICGRVG